MDSQKMRDLVLYWQGVELDDETLPADAVVSNAGLATYTKLLDENGKTALTNSTRQYFENGGTPGCSAGLRFLVVTSRGKLQPCSMHFQRYELDEQPRMIEEFTRTNTCDECYVSIRSYLDKSFPQLLKENVGEYFSFRSDRDSAARAHGQ